ncbi:hypothetical protein AB4Y33_43425, partial [Paraburkholderia sp. BR14319]
EMWFSAGYDAEVADIKRINKLVELGALTDERYRIVDLREVLTAAGPIAVKVPKVRDRSGSGVKFNSTIVPPYVRKSPRV